MRPRKVTVSENFRRKQASQRRTGENITSLAEVIEAGEMRLFVCVLVSSR